VYPSVTADADGDFVVVWNDNNLDGPDGYFIKGRRVSAAGVVQGAEFTVASVDYYEREPRAASTPGGEFVVVWDDFLYGSYPYLFRIRRAQRPPSTDAQLADTLGGVRPDGRDDRLRAPGIMSTTRRHRRRHPATKPLVRAARAGVVFPRLRQGPQERHLWLPQPCKYARETT
jgi:hypothetical protein